ncbi:MAG: hypothetical protein HY913_09280 [Desulfomonile tiedjei]|nr:hypothetical protein [Desulfomonile tiedjei]
MIIGVDFDNTIVTYDCLMHSVAVQLGFIAADISKTKKQVRDAVWQSIEGDEAWQKVQGVVYGPRMGEAKLIGQVDTFFKLCSKKGVEAHIVSHKTEFSNYDATHTNLRMAATEWMRANGLFDPSGMNLPEGNVHFESTRKDKIKRITELKCTHVIDDLEETYLDESFPCGVEKILFNPHGEKYSAVGVRSVTSWDEIITYFFG